MKSCFITARNEDGSAILIVILVLAILTVIGISVHKTTDIELSMVNNDKMYRLAFYGSDSGTYEMAKLVSGVIRSGDIPTSATDPKSGLVFFDTSLRGLYDKILGMSDAEGNYSYGTGPDVYFTLGDATPPESPPVPEEPQIDLPKVEVQVGLRRLGVGRAEGESAEFGTGAEAIGGKLVPVIPFALGSEGLHGSNTKAKTRVIYYNYKNKGGV